MFRLKSGEDGVWVMGGLGCCANTRSFSPYRRVQFWGARLFHLPERALGERGAQQESGVAKQASSPGEVSGVKRVIKS